MRAGLDGVSTARYFLRNREKLNKRATVFTTMATVAQRHREGEPFYVHERHVYQLLKQQQLMRFIDHFSYNETFRAYERRGLIAYDKDGDVWVWIIDPRRYSALPSDYEEYQAENRERRRLMPQIPIELWAPWHFTAQELEQAVLWVDQQARKVPENEAAQAALHVISDVYDEYRKQTGE